LKKVAVYITRSRLPFVNIWGEMCTCVPAFGNETKKSKCRFNSGGGHLHYIA